MSKHDRWSVVELRARGDALVHSVLVAPGARVLRGAPLALFGTLVSFDPIACTAPAGALRSSESGIVLRCHVSSGQAVERGATLFTLLRSR